MGLYSGDLRRAEPSRYARKLANDFADVLNGRAQIVTIAKQKSGRATGAKAARDKAKELASTFGTTMRAKGSKVIVRTASPGERAVYSRTSDTIVTRYKDQAGRIITHEYIKPGNERLPELGPDQTYALPFSRGKDGIFYIERATEEEILALANEYESKGKNPYRDATGHIQIAYIGTTRKKPKSAKRKKRTAEIVDINSARRKRKR